jgi:uncharacterized protein
MVSAALAAFSSGAAAAPPSPADAYRAGVEAWRADRDVRLRAPDGWLSVVGLTWLRPGANRFGSARDNDVILPAPVAAHAGTLTLEGRSVRLDVPAGSPLAPDGGAATGRVLRTDQSPTPDTLRVGTVSWQIIERGARLGVRARDSASPRRQTFAGSQWYAIDPAYRVVARLTPRAGATDIVVPDASGGRQVLKSPGTLTFTLAGGERHLDPMLDGDDDRDELVVFRDQTSGRETYGGGRFVRALRQADGTFVLDFNRAYAPPCALTPYATCPLPPPQNRLAARVEAGEKSQKSSEPDREPARAPEAAPDGATRAPR